MKVLGIGQCTLDMLAVVDPYPAADEKAEVLSWCEQGGGPAATTIATLARLGVPCAFAGVVGGDREGEAIRRIFVDDGVDVSGLVVRKRGRSQAAFIAVERGTGRRTIFWRRITGAELRPRDLPKGFPRAFSFVHLDGMMKDVSIYAAKKARAAGIPVMLDAGRIRDGMREIARHADYLVGSELFARQMGWSDRTPEAVAFRKKILALGVKAATFTFGERGSVTFTRDDWFETPAFRVKTVDTTGAGDVFHGAYIYGLLQRGGLRRTVAFASAVAALKCTTIGGRAGIPTAARAQRLMTTTRRRGLQ